MAKITRHDFIKLSAFSSALLKGGSKILKADTPMTSLKIGDKILKRLKDPHLLEDKMTRVYKGKYRTAINFPIGGNGAGCIQINDRAELARWQIFNNQSQSQLPHSFFAILIKDKKQTHVRALQTSRVGPFKAIKNLTFKGEYPFGWFDFEGPNLPVKVSMEVFNPLIPLNAKDSGIPCAIFNFTVKNISNRPISVSILASQQNAVGFKHFAKVAARGYVGYGGNINQILKEKNAAILHMTSRRAKDDPVYGDMALTGFGNNVFGTAAWTSLDSLKKDWIADGLKKGEESAGPSLPGVTIDGALAASFTLPANKTEKTRFALTWHFPNGVHGIPKFPKRLTEKFGSKPWVHKGNMYNNWYKNALDVARDLNKRIDELTRLTRLYHDTLYSSTLPRWLIDRISSQAAVLRSKTCFWAKDEYFGVWEGSGGPCNTDIGAGCCHGNCSHVLQYAQLHARLFPSLARIMRKGSFDCELPNGIIPFRQPGNRVAADGQFGEILGAFREHLMSADGKWLHKYWPLIKKAMEYGIQTWDKNEDGVLAGAQHNTLDDELGGSTTWIGSLYLAALAACEKMALLEEEQKTAQRYRRIIDSGIKKQNETLWNGEYYIQIPDTEKRNDYLTGCAIDQMLGQWWATQLNLGSFYPQERIRKAMESLIKYNFKPDFRGIKQSPRKFATEMDAGMLMFTWPQGGRPEKEHCVRYTEEVWTGCEYAAAAVMIHSGMIEHGFMVVKAVSDRYDGRLRSDLSFRGPRGFSGNPFGDDECGKYYFRALSVWSVLLACQGFIYDGPAGVIGFKPVWKPKGHSSFFTTANGWGIFFQKRNKSEQTEEIKIKYGELKIRELVFELPKGVKPRDVIASVDNNKKPVKFKFKDRELRVIPGKQIVLKAGAALKINVKTGKA